MKILEIILPSDVQSVMKRLIMDKARQYAPQYALAFGFMFIVSSATALSAWLMKDVVNMIFVERQSTALVWLPMIVIGIFTAKGVASYLQEIILARIGHRMVAETQLRMFDTLLRQDMGY